jgi:hypothetical protein
MTRRTRSVLSILSAFFLGCAGALVVAIFGPLLFPASATGASRGEDLVVFSIPAFFLVFGTAGFMICWKLTKRFVDEKKWTTRTLTD